VAIVALTGWGQEGDKERSRAAGCDGHLVKPVDLPDLERLLAEASESRGKRAGNSDPAPPRRDVAALEAES
jgi:CheY-like chemotaxis protein